MLTEMESPAGSSGCTHPRPWAHGEERCAKLCAARFLPAFVRVSRLADAASCARLRASPGGRFSRAIKRHCPVDRTKGLALRHIRKPCLLEEHDEFAQGIVLGIAETVEKLNE